MDQILIFVVILFAVAFALRCLVLAFVTPQEVSDILTKVSNIEKMAYSLVEQNKQLVEQNKQLAEQNKQLAEQNNMMSKRLFDIENIVDAICGKEAA